MYIIRIKKILAARCEILIQLIAAFKDQGYKTG